RWLVLADTKVTDAGIDELASLDKLALLDLAGTSVKGTKLGRLRRLEEGVLARCGNGGDAALDGVRKCRKLRALNLSVTKVTDKGLGKVKKAPALESLDLWRTAVTGKGLDEIADTDQFKKLQTVNVSETEQLTKDDIARLKKARPRLKVTQ